MASRVVTQLISDLSGEEIPEGSGESIQFGYRGTNYVIDLTADEAFDFDAAMSSWLQHATQQGRTRSGAGAKQPRQSGSDAKAIRAWARDKGIDIPERGRIPASVREQFDAAKN